MGKTLILGIGNTIRYDDGVGIYVARKLSEIIQSDTVDIKETSEAGLNLLDLIIGYDKAIIVDSIFTKEGKVGDIYRLTQEDLESRSDYFSSHRVGLYSVLAIGKEFDLSIPKEIILYAVEIEKGDCFGEGLTSDIKKVIPKVVELIRREV